MFIVTIIYNKIILYLHVFQPILFVYQGRKTLFCVPREKLSPNQLAAKVRQFQEHKITFF